MTDKSNEETKLRAELACEGFRLWKVRQNSPHYAAYGPYAVVDDSTGFVLASGATLIEARNLFLG